MNFTSRTGIKVLVVVVGVGAAGIVADWHLAASPSPPPSLVSPWKPDNLPRVEIVRPRRATVAQRLQTNATLEAFEQMDLFLRNKISRQEMERHYEATWKKQFSKRLRTGRTIQRFFGSPFLSNLLISSLKPFPFVTNKLVSQTHGQPF